MKKLLKLMLCVGIVMLFMGMCVGNGNIVFSGLVMMVASFAFLVCMEARKP